MKKILLLVALLLLSATVIVYFKNTPDEPVKTVEPEQKATGSQFVEQKIETPEDVPTNEILRELEGIVAPGKITAVAFKTDGMLENGEKDFQPGMKFRKNQLLFQVNNYDAFVKMQGDKQALKEKLNAQLTKFPGPAKEKWGNFIASLEPVSLIAELPKVQNPEEQSLIKSVAEDYKSIKQQEANMSAYFYIAPFDGIIVERLVKEGMKIKAGQSIAQIAKQGKMLIKCKAPERMKTMPDAVVILDHQHRFIGNGKIVKSEYGDLYIAAENGKLPSYGTKVFIQL